jgi:TPR repeat protein
MLDPLKLARAMLQHNCMHVAILAASSEALSHPAAAPQRIKAVGSRMGGRGGRAQEARLRHALQVFAVALSNEQYSGASVSEWDVVHWFKAVADMGNSDYARRIGSILLRGTRSMPSQPQEGLKYLLQAAAFGAAPLSCQHATARPPQTPCSFKRCMAATSAHCMAAHCMAATSAHCMAATSAHAWPRTAWPLSLRRGGMLLLRALWRYHAMWCMLCCRGARPSERQSRALSPHAAGDKSCAGDKSAMAQIGHMYANGRGVPQSNETALQYFRHSAEVPNPDASGMFGLGYMHLHGYGLPRNLTAALGWLVRAAKAHNAEALYHVGTLGLDGAADGRVKLQDAIQALVDAASVRCPPPLLMHAHARRTQLLHAGMSPRQRVARMQPCGGCKPDHRAGMLWLIQQADSAG